jgi:hypothetical protein
MEFPCVLASVPHTVYAQGIIICSTSFFRQSALFYTHDLVCVCVCVCVCGTRLAARYCNIPHAYHEYREKFYGRWGVVDRFGSSMCSSTDILCLLPGQCHLQTVALPHAVLLLYPNTRGYFIQNSELIS